MSSDPKASIASKFLTSFLHEIVLETALTTHASIKRARSICHRCGIRCQAHAPAAEQTTTLSSSRDSATPGSRSGTPAPSASSKPDYYSNNPLFECLVCSRQVSSNRYATHLAKCMGMGSKAGRKGAARNAKATTSSAAVSGRQSGVGTPRYSSDLDDDTLTKRKNGLTKNGNKRANSPLAASAMANARMTKRLKTSSPTPPPSDNLGTTSAGMNRSYSSQTFAPSGLSNSTVLSGSPLNPNNTSKPGSSSQTGVKAGVDAAANGNKRKRIIQDDDDDDGDYEGAASDKDSEDGEEGEISDDDDVALASRPSSSGTKIKIAIRGTSSASSTPKPKAFAIADDSDDDSDTNLSAQRNKTNLVSDDEDDDDDDDDEEDEDDEDEDDADDDDDVQVTGVSHGSAATKKKQSSAAGGLQRERGSDGEFIDVESASEQSDADSF